MRVQRVQASILVAALGAAACGERHAILSPTDEAAPNVTIAAKPAGPSIDQVAWTGDFVIDGDAVMVTVVVTHPGKSNLSNVFVAQRVQQGGSTRELGSTPVTCDNAPAGVLVAGATCTTLLSSAVAATGGTGTITAGPADLETVLGQASGRKGKLLATVAEGITLVAPAPPYIESVALETDEFELEGPAVPYTITLANPGAALDVVIVQARMVQEGVERGAAGTEVQCGAASGHLPVGECTFNYAAFASNFAGGDGVLLPGAATLIIDLIHGQTVVDTWSATVELVRDMPFIVSVSWAAQPDVALGPSTSTPILFTLYNPLPSPYSPVNLHFSVTQGDARRDPATMNIHCGGGNNSIAPGFCEESGSLSVHNGLPAGAGSGDLVPGPAVLEITLRSTNDNVLQTIYLQIVLTS